MHLYKRTFLIFTFLYVLFFVKSWGSVTGFIYSHDDVVYYAQTVSLVNDLDVDIKNNLGASYKNLYLPINSVTGKMMSYQPLGPSLLYVIPYALTKPFVLLSSALRRCSFDEYDPLFFVILCFFTFILFYYSGVFLVKTLERYFKSQVSQVITIFTLWGTILPVYVFRRPIFGVIPEFFLVTLLFYYIVRLHKAEKLTFTNTIYFGFIFGFLSITRWNDIYLLPFCLAALICLAKRNRILVHCFLFLFVFAGFFITTQAAVWQSIYKDIKDFIDFYLKVQITYINSGINLPGNHFSIMLKNLFHILFGLDWGLLFTMPVLLFGALPFITNNKLKVFPSKLIQGVFFATVFIVPFYLVLQWRKTGDFYGYRFLISLLPFCAFGLSDFLEKRIEKYQKVITLTILLFCLLNFFVILPFELTDKVSLLTDNITPMGGKGWGNNYYVLNSLKFYFSSDIKTLISLFSRGYLAFFTFGIISKLGFDLAIFSPKVKSYFSLDSYKSLISILYFVLIIIWALFIKYDGSRKNQHSF